MPYAHVIETFELTDELTTGIEELDAQHEYFLALTASVQRKSRELDIGASHELILEVARYAQCHFAYEETMMSVYGYPRMQEHIEQHLEIIAKLKAAAAISQFNLSQARLELLQWVVSHIPLDDKPLAEFVLTCRPTLTKVRCAGEPRV